MMNATAMGVVLVWGGIALILFGFHMLAGQHGTDTGLIEHALNKADAGEYGYVDAAVRILAARRGIKNRPLTDERRPTR